MKKSEEERKQISNSFEEQLYRLVKTCRKIWWFWKPSHFRKTFWGGNQCGSQEEDGAHGGGGKQGVVPNARREFSKVKVESEEEA